MCPVTTPTRGLRHASPSPLSLSLNLLPVSLSRFGQLFTVHILGYSLADTALVALISRYASPSTQGRSLGLNQAAQSMARVVSPVVSQHPRKKRQ